LPHGYLVASVRDHDDPDAVLFQGIFFRGITQTQLESIADAEREAVQSKIASLIWDSDPKESEPLAGYDDAYRLRVGRWRVVYEVNATMSAILIHRIVPRTGSTYDDLERDLGPRRR
jgi:mRNA-degrading endonuclease RelE of RelBE toxin-antitoxin system